MVVRNETKLSLPSKGRLGSIKWLPRGDFARWAGLSLLFLAVAVVQTWPLLIHITNSIADSQSAPIPDTYAFLWDLSWVKQALVDLHTNPYETNYIVFPEGEHLYLHPLTLVNGVMSIPLQVATGNLIFSWNVLALLCFTFSGLATYAIGYRVTQNHLAAILAGFIFAFAPVVMMQFNGRWHISTTWPIPLMVLFTLRFLDNGRYREAAAAAVCWALLLYNNQEFALDAALFFALFFTYWSFVYFRRQQREQLISLWKGGAVIAAVWLVLAAPLVIPASIDARSGDYFLPAGDEDYSADLRSFIIPSPLWGPGTDPNGGVVPPHQPGGTIENTLYLGGVPLLLATVALFSIKRAPHRVLLWLLLFSLFFILSLGPWLYVTPTTKVSIPLPYQIYDQLPLFGDRRVPSRMLPFGMLGLAMVAAVGLDFLMAKMRHRHVLLGLAVGAVAIGLVGLEYWNPPVHTTRLQPPAILEQIRDEPGDFSVLDLPLGRRTGWGFNGHLTGAAIADYYQSVHKKHVFGGFIARTKERTLAWLREEPGLRRLAFIGEEPLPDDLDRTTVRSVFNKYQIKYVVLHRIGPHGQPIDQPAPLDKMDEYVRTVVGLTLVESGPELSVYRNPDVP
jgi:hypothetical protein